MFSRVSRLFASISIQYNFFVFYSIFSSNINSCRFIVPRAREPRSTHPSHSHYVCACAQCSNGAVLHRHRLLFKWHAEELQWILLRSLLSMPFTHSPVRCMNSTISRLLVTTMPCHCHSIDCFHHSRLSSTFIVWLGSSEVCVCVCARVRRNEKRLTLFTSSNQFCIVLSSAAKHNSNTNESIPLSALCSMHTSTRHWRIFPHFSCSSRLRSLIHTHSIAMRQWTMNVVAVDMQIYLIFSWIHSNWDLNSCPAINTCCGIRLSGATIVKSGIRSIVFLLHALFIVALYVFQIPSPIISNMKCNAINLNPWHGYRPDTTPTIQK